jgi:tetratricopeptide (TPR) repeat protein
MLPRFIDFIEFFVLLVASIASAFFYFSPQVHDQWRPVAKYAMWTIALVAALSEFVLKDLTGKGWEDRAAHAAGYAFCAVIPHFSACFARTIAELNEAIREHPTNPRTFLTRGNAYFAHGDPDRAIEDFDGAIRLDPTFASAFAGRAYAYRAKRMPDRALADIEQAGKLDRQFIAAKPDFEFAANLSLLPPDEFTYAFAPAPAQVSIVSKVERELAPLLPYTPGNWTAIPTPSNWLIQVGAFNGEREAHDMVDAVQAMSGDRLKHATPVVERLVTGDKTLYRSRFSGLQKDEAEAICRELQRNNIACIARRV